jgi:FG-GAP-like repeat
MAVASSPVRAPASATSVVMSARRTPCDAVDAVLPIPAHLPVRANITTLRQACHRFRRIMALRSPRTLRRAAAAAAAAGALAFAATAQADQFAAPAQFPAGDGIAIRGVGDFDGDRAVDVLIVDGSGRIEIAHGDGAAGVSAVTVVDGPALQSAADGTGDGRPDLLGIGGTPDAPVVQARVADGAGGFGPVIESAAGTPVAAPRGFVAGDVDGDGHVDLVVAEPTGAGSRLWVAPGNGDGSFDAWWSAGETRATGGFVLVGDDNGDGRPELAGHDDAGTVWISPSDPVEGFGAARPSPPSSAATALRDMVAGAFEQRGRPAVAAVDPSRNCVVVALASAQPALTPCRPFRAPIVGLAAGDIDGDGRSDVVHGASGGVLGVLYGRRDGLTPPAEVAVPGAAYVSDPVVVDLDGDGRNDVVAIANLRTLVVLRNIGEFRPAADPTAVAFPQTAVGYRSASVRVLVRNEGDVARRLPAAAVSGADAGQFRISGDLCRDAVLAPGEACAVRVRFVPTVAGTHAATLDWTTDAFSVSVPLAGDAVCVRVPQGGSGRATTLAAPRSRVTT